MEENSKNASSARRRGRRPAGPPLTDDEAHFLSELVVSRGWNLEAFYRKFADANPEAATSCKREHFARLITMDGKRAGLMPHFRPALAATFGVSAASLDEYLNTGDIDRLVRTEQAGWATIALESDTTDTRAAKIISRISELFHRAAHMSVEEVEPRFLLSKSLHLPVEARSIRSAVTFGRSFRANEFILSCSDDGPCFHVFNLPNGDWHLGELQVDTQERPMIFLTETFVVLVAEHRGHITLLPVGGSEPIRLEIPIEATHKSITDICVHGDILLMSFCTPDVWFLDLKTLKFTEVFKSDGVISYSCADFLGPEVVLCGDESVPRLRIVARSGSELIGEIPLPAAPSALTAYPDHGVVVVATWDGVFFYSTDDWRLIRRVPLPYGGMFTHMRSAERSLWFLQSGHMPSALEVLDVVTGDTVFREVIRWGGQPGYGITSDGRALAFMKPNTHVLQIYEDVSFAANNTKARGTRLESGIMGEKKPAR